MDNYVGQTTIPLTYRRIRGTVVSGLTVTVGAVNVNGNATLLSPVACVETATGSGVYVYNWTHGLTQDTECLVTYTVSGQALPVSEFIFISGVSAAGGRSV